MKQLDIDCVREITGAEIYGGEALPPLAVGLILAGIGYLVEKWPEMKQGFLDGYAGR